MLKSDLEEQINTSLKFFPTTRYQGSKRRLLPWLYKIFNRIEFESVLDGFGGSASASYLFKLMGKRVDFNDILKSNYQTGLALIENTSVILEEKDIELLLKNRCSNQFPSLITNLFEDIYFYPEENDWLDMMVFNIEMLSEIYTDEVLKIKQALAFHSLFQACLSKRPYNLFHRKNLYLRKADVKRSFGNKKTWDKEFPSLFRKFTLEISSKVFSNNQFNKAHCGDLLDFEFYDYDLIYLDPPYQRPSEKRPKDYLSLYHFLEGLTDYENWSANVDFSKKHRPLQKELSKFDSLNPVERFELIFDKFNKSTIAISYGAPGKPTIDEISTLLKKHKKYVYIFDTEYSYKLNKKNGSNLREVLIIGSASEVKELAEP